MCVDASEERDTSDAVPTIDAPMLGAQALAFPLRWETRATCRNAPHLFVSPLAGEAPRPRLDREDAANRVLRDVPRHQRMSLLRLARCTKPIGIWGGLTTERRSYSSDA